MAWWSFLLNILWSEAKFSFTINSSVHWSVFYRLAFSECLLINKVWRYQILIFVSRFPLGPGQVIFPLEYLMIWSKVFFHNKPLCTLECVLSFGVLRRLIDQKDAERSDPDIYVTRSGFDAYWLPQGDPHLLSYDVTQCVEQLCLWNHIKIMVYIKRIHYWSE